MNFETKWTGTEKLIIVIDVGTTQTAVSYAYLLPQGLPVVARVTDWPGQGSQQGDAKVPSLIWYDRRGNPQVFGAEAQAKAPEDAEENGWQLAKHFKLHLHPETMKARHQLFLDPLPKGVTIDKIYADFFGFAYRHAQTFFKERELQGTKIWQDLLQSKKIEFVIAHPNGWTLNEQAFLRNAAAKGGLTTQDDSSRTIHMITEAEASVHFVMFHGGVESRLERGADLLVCDAGGSTVDTTLYTVTGTSPLELKEKRASDCVQAGGIFVNQEARKFLDAEFRRAKIKQTDDVLPMSELEGEFEVGKKDFADPLENDIKLRVGMMKLNASVINLSRGTLTLEGQQIAKFFSRPVKDIIASIKGQMKGHSVKYLMLVGGFGDSHYLRGEIRRHFCERSDLMLANAFTGKAVADGAAAWFIRRSVTGRATRFAYGINMKLQYDPSHSRHEGREIHHDIDGDFVYGIWSEIAAKDYVFDNDVSQRRHYSQIFTIPRPFLGEFTVRLLAHTGSGTAPYFAADDAGDEIMPGFTKVCEVVADLSNMAGTLVKTDGPRGVYWRVNFKVGILFGGNELAAKLFWKDANHRECQSEATIIPKQFS